MLKRNQQASKRIYLRSRTEKDQDYLLNDIYVYNIKLKLSKHDYLFSSLSASPNLKEDMISTFAKGSNNKEVG